MIEVWKQIPGFENLYEVSNHGRIRSLTHSVIRLHYTGKPNKYTINGRILKQYLNKGYYQLFLSKNSKTTLFKVHYLILITFFGNRPQGMWACHNNGNSSDNRIENLRWDTPSSNSMDTIKHGNHKFTPSTLRGSKNQLAKLTENDVLTIRSIPVYRGYLTEMAKKYNVSKSAICSIVHRKTWTHI